MTALPRDPSIGDHEYRVTWRRFGGRLRHRVFQSRRGADDLYERLRRYMPEDRDLWPCWYKADWPENFDCDDDCDCGVSTGMTERVLILKVYRRRVLAWEKLL